PHRPRHRHRSRPSGPRPPGPRRVVRVVRPLPTDDLDAREERRRPDPRRGRQARGGQCAGPAAPCYLTHEWLQAPPEWRSTRAIAAIRLAGGPPQMTTSISPPRSPNGATDLSRMGSNAGKTAPSKMMRTKSETISATK